MKNIFFTSIINKLNQFFIPVVFLTAILFTCEAQVKKDFKQRSSIYSPNKKIYNVKGDFTIIGNTNLTLQNYGDNTSNDNPMVYIDSDGDSNTLNSSSASLVLNSENGVMPECSKIIYAGLYWTGRSSDAENSPTSFTVNKNGIVKVYDKKKISLKGPSQSNYVEIVANENDIYYPDTSDRFMYAAYAEVTDYVRANGLGSYTAADIALVEGDGGGTGFYGGWSLIVVYENSKMKYRDVTIFDGYAFISRNDNGASFELPVSGFNTATQGHVEMKLGLIAGEGDRAFEGDYFQIRKQNDGSFMNLSHSGNSTGNFFNSSIQTGGNTRNPNLLNNTGLDVSMFNIPNISNQVITNNQTSTTFKFGTTKDTYIIFAMAMAVDAYMPVIEDLIVGGSVNGTPITGPISSVLPGDEINFKINIFNKGTEAINNTKHIIPIPYMVDYVPGSLIKNVNFSPLPSPNNYYFDPSLGPKGSIVYDFGTLPLPANPDTILADFSFKVKVTTDCSTLKNSACGHSISISGTISGTGSITGVDFHNKPLIIGHTSTGMCTGEPILNPLTIPVNATAYVNQNCQSTPAMRDFVFCNPGTTIPITAINSGFPPGSRFYNLAGTTEYTISNPFPATSGAVKYYAIPPDAVAGCDFPFAITITNVITKPVTAVGVAYCQGANALPLTATTSGNNPSYMLYYFTSENGTPQLSITPSTDVVGSTTYWVAEAASGNCIGPKVPIVVTVNAMPSHPTTTVVQPTCAVATGTITVTSPTGPGVTYSIDGSNYSNTSGIFSGLAAGTYSVSSKTQEGCTCSPSIVIINPQPAIPNEPTKVNCWDTYTFNTETCLWVNNNTPKPVEPTKVNCWDIFTFNPSTCVWDVTGTQPIKPTVLCYETATWNPSTCVWDVTGTQPVKPTVLCYETATWNPSTCVWDLTGTQPVKPTVLCYETATWNPATCVWDVTGTQPIKPTVLCYETATWNPTTCVWDVTGTQPIKPTVLCYETATWNPATCVWDVTGTQPIKPTVLCYETATWNPATCVWDVTGTQPIKPTVLCYETATWNPATCVWDVTGTQPIKPTVLCYETATWNPSTCVWDVTGTQPVKPTVLCYETATWNPATCVWDVTGTQPIKPTVLCYETATWNPTTCVWDVTGTQPIKPTVLCYETATWNPATCVWDVTGTQPVKPTVLCYETATWNPTTCVWDVTGTQPIKPTVLCYETATWNPTTCVWDVTGTQPIKPTVLCYETATWNPATCVWDVTGTQPVKPTVLCYETATWNPTTCVWDVTGTQPIKPTVLCYETATWNPATCVWDVTGTQPVKPTVLCYETATWNPTTCVWDVTGTQPIKPTVLCYETATWNPATCVWDVTGTQPVKPTVLCYETATWNPATCVWDVTGTQPVKPTVLCYETATWNPTTCVWDVTGTQPIKPTVLCYETATWNPATCVWDVTGTQPVKPTVLCYETATWNPATCVWDVTGTQPVKPTVLCYETATWNPATCVWDVTGTQPVKPTVLCYETATWNPATCVWDVTGTQPVKPTVLCYETATWNPTTCVWDVTGTQPIKPTVLCYETATWNPATCVWDVTGTQPVKPTVLCYETATWNPATCVWDVTGTQPIKPTVLCYETATWNPATCVWDVTGTQPVKPTVLCYETATWNPATCVWDVTGTQPVKPKVLCYETATWNPTTCVWDVTGTQPIKPTVLCYETATWNPATCVWDVTGTQPPTADAGKDVNINCTTSTTLSASGGIKYAWSPAEGLSATNIANPIAKPEVTTTYTVTVTDENGCTATDSVIVSVINLIIANDDDGNAVNGFNGGISFSNVLTNDLLNCKAVKAEEVTISFVSSTNPGITLNGTNVVVAAGTPAGNYTLTYQICEIANPNNCDQADVIVIVTTPKIDAVNDNAGQIVGVNQITIGVINIFTNDNLNGLIVNPSEVTLTTDNANPFLHINPDGSVDVLPNAPEGPQTVSYQICEKLNPANCDTAIVTVIIEKPVMKITANAICINDVPYINYTATAVNFTPINGLTITWADSNNNVVTTMTNLPLSGQVLWPGAVVDQNGNGIDWPGWIFTNNQWIEAADGFENLRPKATLTFELNPTETIVVDYPPSDPFCTSRPKFVIDAINDDAGPILGINGATNVLNVFTNDTLNNLAVNPTDVTLSIVTPDPTGFITLNPNGSVDVKAGTPAGTYILTYSICEKADSGNCDTAIVTITVTAPAIIAQDDTIAGGNGLAGNPNAGNVLGNNGNGNDTLNGVNVTIDQVNLTVTTPATSIGGGSVPTVNTATGQISVPAGTPAGTYTIVYQICEKLNPTNCDSATVTITVTAPAIIAQDDTIAGGNGAAGNPNAGNVLGNNGNGNDTLNGVNVTIDQVNLTVTTPATSIGGGSVPSIDTATGQISIPAGTPAGIYTIVYQICEKLNPSNCDSATVTITVTAPKIDAIDDTIAGGNGAVGNPNAGNVLGNNGNGNDTLNGIPVTINQVNLTVTTPATSIGGGSVPSINTATGQISIPAGTPAGIYTIVYQICEKLNPSNCDSATVTITVTAPKIDAVDDTIAGGNGAAGNPNAGNVLSNNGNGNDTINGVTVTIDQVNLTVTTPATSIGGGSVPTVNTATGQISVPAGTPAGTYTIVYQICEKLNPTNCDSATVTITVTAPAIIAQDDTIAGGNGAAGNPNAGNVLGNNGNGNDTLNGVNVTIDQVNLTVTTPATSIGGGSVPSIDTATGQISIPAGTPAGIYTIVYQICEKLNPSNCDSATVTITVTAPKIDAIDDTIAGGNGAVGNPNAGNVLGNNGNGNDTLNGIPVTINQVNLTVTTPATSIGGGSVPSINTATGQISIPAGTPAGIYTIVYQICEKLNPSNCDSATVTITVTAPAIIAQDDTIAGGNGLAGNPNAGNVLGNNGNGNDTLNGVNVTIDQVNLTLTTPATSIGGGSVPTVNTATGQISIPAGTPAGTYTIVYQICEKLNPNNCDSATVTITVTAPAIIAQDDTIAGGNGAAGNPNAGNVLGNNGNGNDTLNGVNVTIDQVNLTVTTPATSIGGGSVPSIDTATGQISIPAGTPAGIYTIVYQICEKLNPSNCDSATVTITVTAPKIDAIDDTIAGGNGAVGNPNAGNVLGNNGNGNDTLNGIPVTINQVNLTVTTPATSIGGGSVPSINTATGQISIPAGTPAGIYTIVYQICEKLNPSNCDSATVTITVTAPKIDAVDDTIAGGNGAVGNPNAGNVLGNNGNGNDTLNGIPVTINQVNLTVTTPATSIGGGSVPSINTATGQISIPAGTPAGIYTIVYQICEKLNPSNCDSATVTITVTAPAIIAQDDTIAGGNGLAGNPNAGNVLGNNGNGNDTLNGVNVTIDQVNLTLTTPATSIGGGSVPTVNTATGQISIPAGTPAGTYTIVYQICEKLNPNNCDSATVTITVTAPAIIAQDDTIAGGNGAAGNSNAGNVLSNNGNGNDTLNGVPVTINQVNLTVTTPATSIGGGSVPTVNTATGQISIPAGTPAGVYTIVYQICEKLNTTNCDSATVTITVTAPIVANDDRFIDVDGGNGSPNIGNVLNNNGNGTDTLNGVNVTIAQVNLTVTTPATSIGGGSVPSIDPTTGQISVPAGTPAGTYIIVYQICEKANPSNCDSAIVTIEVAVVLGVDCDAIVVHKALTPNGDGANDYLQIDGVEDIDCYPSGISVEIYNRWGILVFETSKYSNTENYFDGYSKGRTTISKSDGLPTGTYFYILNYESFDGNGNIQINKKEGFIYLSR